MRSSPAHRPKNEARPARRTARVTTSICSLSDTRSRTIVRFSGFAARSAAASAPASLAASIR